MARFGRVLMCILGLTAPWSAGGVFVPGKMDVAKFVPDAKVGTGFYAISYATLTADIQPTTGKATLRETYAGPEDAVDCVGLFPLPAFAQAGGATLEPADPQLAEACQNARFLKADECRRFMRRSRSAEEPDHSGYSGRPALWVDRMPMGGKLSYP